MTRRQGGFTDGTLILSPRSNETGGLGAKMVEYVLGASPTGKDLDSRMPMRHLVNVRLLSNYSTARKLDLMLLSILIRTRKTKTRK